MHQENEKHHHQLLANQQLQKKAVNAANWQICPESKQQNFVMFVQVMYANFTPKLFVKNVTYLNNNRFYSSEKLKIYFVQ